MSSMSHLLSRAIGGRRATSSHRSSREAILAALLGKRAAAYRAGLDELEQQLRSHILWALPIQRPEDRPDQKEKQTDEHPSQL
jgi:hypothetical protein